MTESSVGKGVIISQRKDRYHRGFSLDLKEVSILLERMSIKFIAFQKS
jgi:hypothetical protein